MKKLSIRRSMPTQEKLELPTLGEVDENESEGHGKFKCLVQTSKSSKNVCIDLEDVHAVHSLERLLKNNLDQYNLTRLRKSLKAKEINLNSNILMSPLTQRIK